MAVNPMFELRNIILIWIMLVALAVPVSAQQQQLQLGQDVLISGQSVALDAPVAGDALMAGGSVRLGAPVNGDAAVAGGEIEIGGPVAQDLYAAGGQLRVTGAVTGSARLAGGDIQLAQTARVGKGLSAAGGRIALDGVIGSYAQVAGGDLTINGTVNGNVEAAGGSLRLGPNAVIQGQLVYRGPQDAEVAAGAQVRGGIQNIAYQPPMMGQSMMTMFGIAALVWFIGWAIVGAILLVLLPEETRRVTLTAEERPGFAALIGLIALIVVPIVIMLLFVSLIGIPLAVLVAFLYFVLLPFGYLAGVAAISDWFLPRFGRAPMPPSTGRRIGFFVLALLVIAVVTQIPVIGWLIGLLILIAGMGAVLLALTGRGVVRTWSV